MLQDGTQRYFIYREEEPSHHFQPDTTSKAELQTWCIPPTSLHLEISDVCDANLRKKLIGSHFFSLLKNIQYVFLLI